MTPTFFTSRGTLVALIVSLSLFILPFVAVAQFDNNGGNINNNGGGFNNTGGNFDNNAGNFNNNGGLQNPLSVDSFPELFELIFQAALIIGIPIAVLFIVYAGFRLVWARGNPTELEIARRHLLWTIIGVAIFVGAAIIVEVIVNTLCTVGVEGVGSC